MSLVSLVLLIIILGFLVYCTKFIPMDDRFRQLAVAVIIIGFLIWVLQQFGHLGPVIH